MGNFWDKRHFKDQKSKKSATGRPSRPFIPQKLTCQQSSILIEAMRYSLPLTSLSLL
jgi:hypothetical protein